MNQLQVEMDVKNYADSRTIESAFKQLWEKVRTAAELISQLRDENKTYKSQRENFESEINRLKAELTQKENELKRLKADHNHLSQSMGGNNILTAEEKESLKTRIKDLISKINSHL